MSDMFDSLMTISCLLGFCRHIEKNNRGNERGVVCFIMWQYANFCFIQIFYFFHILILVIKNLKISLYFEYVWGFSILQNKAWWGIRHCDFIFLKYKTFWYYLQHSVCTFGLAKTCTFRIHLTNQRTHFCYFE